MKYLYEIAKPGLMLSQTWPTSNERKNATLRAFEIALEKNFFTSFQTVGIPFAEERRQIARMIGASGYSYTYCLTRILNENHLNLSDLDTQNRKKSYEKVIQCLDDVREAGARACSVVSGPNPGDPEKRVEALKMLEDSLEHIAQEADRQPKIGLVIEPLDVLSHKRMTLGYISEAVEICEELKKGGLSLNLCLDTAHHFLNGEDPVEALKRVRDYTVEFHYCNCVVDTNHPLFGDRHIPFGEPGVLDIEGISRIMKKQVEMGFFNREDKPLIMCEVKRRGSNRSEQVMEYCSEVFKRAWELADEKIQSS